MTEDEFLQIYRDQASTVFRFSAFLTGSTQEAEDLTAEAFARMLDKGGRVPADKRVAWLHTVTRNLCADYGRRRRVETIDGVELQAPESERVWLDASVLAAIRRLSPKTQQVLFLHTIEDLSFAQIGHLLSMTETAARMRHHRAISQVRSVLEVKACPETETM